MRDRSRLTTVLALTAVVHLVLAVGVACHARTHGRDAEKWAAATLGGGLVGVVAYVLFGGRDAESALSA